MICCRCCTYSVFVVIIHQKPLVSKTSSPFWRVLAPRCGSEGRCLNPLPIGNGAQTNTCIVDRRWDLLKTNPGTGFIQIWKSLNSQPKWKVFHRLKQLKVWSCRLQARFYKFWKHWKRCEKGGRKLWCRNYFWYWWRIWSTYSLVLSILDNVAKSLLLTGV